MRRFHLDPLAYTYIIPAVQRMAQRFLTAMTLALWLAPGASALAVGLHVALGHHTHGGDEAQHALLSLARAAVHGHHHDLGTAWDHDHEVIGTKRAPAPRPNSTLIAVLPSSDVLGADIRDSSRLGPAPQCRPPTPLFAVYSSLLL